MGKISTDEQEPNRRLFVQQVYQLMRWKPRTKPSLVICGQYSRNCRRGPIGLLVGGDATKDAVLRLVNARAPGWPRALAPFFRSRGVLAILTYTRSLRGQRGFLSCVTGRLTLVLTISLKTPY